MTNILKNELFNRFVQAGEILFTQIENNFGFHDIKKQFFGRETYDKASATEVNLMRAWVRDSKAWTSYSTVFDYAVDGIIQEFTNPFVMINEAAQIVSLLITTNPYIAGILEPVIIQAEGRSAMEMGQFIRFEALVALAGLDERTVRNAISAGDLIFQKNDGKGLIDPVSARNWLTGRRGYKHTRIITSNPGLLKDVTSPAQFGAFLKASRIQFSNHLHIENLPVDQKSIGEIENGIFNLSLNVTFDIADYYRIDRNEFLKCVMRIFFRDQYDALLR